ncbi:MAG: hypothetical protein U0R51_08265 [Solirubrobacterales bacterium]
MSGKQYRDVEMPDQFLLEFRTDDGTWIEEARCRRDEFVRLDDGAYICSSGGSGTWIRCVEYLDEGFVHVDGGGDRFVYRLVPLPPLPDA